MQNEQVLTMISGGRDSLLAACLLIEDGYSVIPVTFDNGHIEGIKRVNKVYHTIEKKCLHKHTKHPDFKSYRQNIAMSVLDYTRIFWMQTTNELAKKYPNIKGYQVNCLCCKTAMYIHAIATCKQFDIPYLADGVRESQGFITDSSEMIDRFKELYGVNNVTLLTPVNTLDDDWKRKRMLSDRGLPTKTFEPQCFLGCPLENGGLTRNHKLELVDFYDNELRGRLQGDIDNLVKSKKWV